MSVDATDRRILEALQRKGRMSNADLSEQVNLRASACHRRVQRLEAEGYIRDYVALLDARKMGVSTTVFRRDHASGQADEVLDAFEKAVRRIPDVLECHLMAGTADYILKVVAEKHRGFRPDSPPAPGAPARRRADAVELRAADGVQDDGLAGLGGAMSDWDYIVVGAGSAGCVVSKRLSDAGHRVLLLEAGGKDNYHWVHIPMGYLYCIGNPRTDWMYRTAPVDG